ncbi:proline-rich protein 4-like [Quillaja saponaria]|uniref:Proline-rich protein 4-like n=1 Tax=Quillaja saponaria TaxID=32244 RepID=A0AAD7QBQ8_QUISA|nr:proline-rich protein 4-like [Quillaja saponaria]
MRIFPFCRGALLCFWLSLFFAAVSFCYGDHSAVEVVGIGECSDCNQNNIKSSHAFSGLRVTVDCKPANGHFETRGIGELDEEGKFKVFLPHEVVKDGNLTEECFAQLHSAAAAPCPAHNGLDSSKIVFKSKTDEKHTFGLAGKLKFSPVTCTSAVLWPFFNFPPLPSLPPLPNLSPLPKLPPLSKHLPFPPKIFPPIPPKVFPPFPPKVFPPFPPKVFPPINKKLLPPPITIYKKPLLPPLPVFKKPLPPLVPAFKMPLPPSVPIFKKPLPPFPKFPPFKRSLIHPFLKYHTFPSFLLFLKSLTPTLENCLLYLL